MKELSRKLGDRIRQLRKSQRLSQEVLAEKVNINPKYFGQIERGEVNASLNTLNKIAKALSIHLYELFSFSSTEESVTKKELLISNIIGLVKEKDERTIDIIGIIIKDILNWRQEINEERNKEFSKILIDISKWVQLIGIY